MLDGIDPSLELARPLPVVGQTGDGEGADPLADLFLQACKGRFPSGGDEDSSAQREVMANDVRDRVSLPGPGRPLHTNPCAPLKSLNYCLLLGVVWEWKVQLLRRGRSHLPTARDASKVYG